MAVRVKGAIFPPNPRRTTKSVCIYYPEIKSPMECLLSGALRARPYMLPQVLLVQLRNRGSLRLRILAMVVVRGHRLVVLSSRAAHRCSPHADYPPQTLDRSTHRAIAASSTLSGGARQPPSPAASSAASARPAVTAAPCAATRVRPQSTFNVRPLTMSEFDTRHGRDSRLSRSQRWLGLVL